MRNALLLSFMLVTPAALLAQGAPPASPPSQTAPTQPRPPAARPRPRVATPAARSGIAITATSPAGDTLENVHVEVTGPESRNGDTNAAGQVNFPGLPAGTYMVRFSGDAVVTLEREATLRAGQVAQLQVTLKPTAAQKAAAPAPAPRPPAAGPVGSPQWGSLTDLAKKAAQTKPPQREILLSCSGNERSLLMLLTEDQPQRVYDGAEMIYYVLDGQGSVKIGDRDGPVAGGSFVAVPRGMPFTVTRRGNKPLVLLSVLSGVPCEQAR